MEDLPKYPKIAGPPGLAKDHIEVDRPGPRGKMMKQLSLRAAAYVTPLFVLIVTITVLIWASDALAYSDYSGCSGCHGDFRASPYISLSDGANWGDDLHDVHRNDMLAGDCNTCHTAAGRSPVFLDRSSGGSGLGPISCVGCHGRDEDMGNDSESLGRGAGLRQYHTRAGEADCTDCHSDALLANYTPVGEDVLPNYYANPGTNHPTMPTDSCNPFGSEGFFAGTLLGLDNDGDGIYDTADPDCGPVDDDTDGDGIADVDEVNTYGTDPNDADTDSDGLEDGVELFSANKTDPLDQDSDGDGLFDGAEDLNTDGVFDVGVESDPVDADTDDDGSSDGDEVNVSTTDPLNPDSDGDGLPDGLELGVTTPIPGGLSDGNSVVQVAFGGTDSGIFVSDADPSTKTDPNNADTDGDLLTDGFEDTNHNGRLDEGETDPLTSDEPPPPPEITCLEAAKAVIDAAHDYQRTSRNVAKDCGRQANDDCAATLQAQIDAFVVLESEQIFEEQACQP